MKNIKYIFTIILLLAAINPIVGNLYLPSLPSMQQAFKTTTHLAQLTIAFSALGAAIVQPFYGLLSDALGRRKVLLTGLFIATIGSLICFLASDIYLMLSGRLIQGMGIGCTLALSRAITRDRYAGTQLSKISSATSIIKVAMLNIAPLAGAYIEELLGWHANFAFILIYIALILLLVFALLPETNRYRNNKNLKLAVIGQAVKTLFRSRSYLGACLLIACSFAAMYSWITVSPILFINQMQLSPAQYGWVMASSGIFYIGSMLFNIRYVSHYGTSWMMTTGIVLTVFASIVMIILAPLHHWLAMIIAIYIFIAGMALILSNAISTALTPFAKIAGIAGALTSTCQLLGSALASSVVAALGLNSQMALGITVLFLMTIALLAKLFLLAKPARHPEDL